MNDDVPLARALRALERGDERELHLALADAWRARRSSALGELAELAHLRSPSPIQERLAELQGARVTVLVARVRALSEVDDPIFARWILRALEEPPFLGPSSRPLLELLLDIAERLADPRLVERAGPIARVWEHRVTPKPSRVALTARLEAIAARIAPPPAPSAEEAALEAAIAAKLRPVASTRRTEADLFAEVYAHPADDGPRLVLADFLLERGDPRGELITIQLRRREGGLSPDAAKREAELLKKHGKAWLGPLAAVVTWGKSYSSSTFERGFLATADIMLSAGKKLLFVMDEPSWAVVEEIRGSWDAAMLLRAPLHGLRRLELAGADLRELAERERVFPNLELLETSGDLGDGSVLAQVCPALRTLMVTYEHGPTLAEAAAVLALAPVQRVVFQRWAGARTPAVPLPELVAGVRSFAPSVPEIALEPLWPRGPQPTPIELRIVDGRYEVMEAEPRPPA